MPQHRTVSDHPSTVGPITFSEGSISILDASTFGPDGGEACNRFLGGAFALPEVVSIQVDRRSRTATLRHEAGRGGLPDLLTRLAQALRPSSLQGPAIPLPMLDAAPKFSLHRHGSTLTTWEVVADAPGRLKLRQPSLKGDPVLLDQIKAELLGLPGIRVVKSSERTGHLLIRYDPASISPRALLGRAEAALLELQARELAANAGLPDFRMANLTLAVAALGEFLIPGLLPVSAVLLLATNFPTFRSALALVKEKRLGLPVLYLTIVAITLLTGQFLASALMTWLFRFWHRRFRVDLASGRIRLLEQVRSEPAMARLVVPSGAEVLVTVGRLREGDRIVVLKDDLVPADGPILAGEGVVDERLIRGSDGISVKRAGDWLLAGSKVLAGAFQIEVTRLGDRSRAGSIRRTLVAATNPMPGQSAPTVRSERFATRAVGPTLATAGVGLLSGDLLTVGAILRPDYATGPGLAVPLETLHHVALSARSGIVARDAEALERLAEVELIVLQDHPSLRKLELAVTRIETRLPEPLLLRYAASAFRHLVDDRAKPLVEACRAARAHVLDLTPVEFGRGVTVVHGSHRIRVSSVDPAEGPSGRLAVEVDGAVVGWIEFGPTQRLEAASAIERFRRDSNVPFALVSPHGSVEVSDLAKSLGVEMFRGDFTADDSAEFLGACRSKGLKVAFIGDCRAHPVAATRAHVAVSFADDPRLDLDLDPSSFLLQQPGLGPIVELGRIAKDHANRVVQAQQLILVPNLLCVAGAFFFGFTGMTVVMLSNLGTLGLYRIASDPLRGLDPPREGHAGRPRRAG